ncbi:hypothetical protein [Vibrio parahaemolyticus]|uniref:hypothetical protein n=1 Tax=Vibrio parahaemolyticus TaxID=670 RepID=UPI0011241A72|nr:hypothetical protein [Vibrio parahaemolyticus]TOP91716.1 hypothetical protein CGH07_12605 [Vibrio parahaemolyticus]HCG5284338.1 hypothetical protein [Vibrio parahaemolyticus]
MNFCQSSNVKVVILDPGLREYGGHHVGLLSQLRDSKFVSNGELLIEVLGSVDASEELRANISAPNLTFTPHFITDFYKYFYSDGSLKSFTRYIRDLSIEYYRAILKYKKKDVMFFYHTLNWEHGYALTLALGMLDGEVSYKNHSVNHQHLIGLMFSPQYFNSEDNSRSQQRVMRFSLGFRKLASFQNVHLFSADYEVRQAYKKLLGIDKISPCPCGLVRDEQMLDISASKVKSKKVLLYIGDAKDNKGFLELPRLLENMLVSTADPSVKFVVHYTITNDRKDLRSVHCKLKHLARENSCIELHHGFMSERELHQLWLSTHSIVLNYDSQLYANQSSGILWLSAAYEVNLYLLSDTWLNREAKRLQLKLREYRSISELAIDIRKNGWNDLNPIDEVDGYIKYRQELLSDLSQWLANTVRNLTNN